MRMVPRMRSGMTTIIFMAEHDRLTLMQWLSPAFPLGAFAYSHGLEAAISQGDVTDAAGLLDWLTGVLRFGAGRSDAILLRAALGGGQPDELSALAAALASSRERWEEVMAQGRAFAATHNALSGNNNPAAPLPIALGVAARGLRLDAEEIVSLYLHGFASNLVSAAVRFVPMGQTEGQQVLAALHPVIADVAHETQGLGPDQIRNASFGADLAAMAHETLDVRIFRS